MSRFVIIGVLVAVLSVLAIRSVRAPPEPQSVLVANGINGTDFSESLAPTESGARMQERPPNRQDIQAAAASRDWDRLFQDAQDAQSFVAQIQRIRDPDPQALYYGGKMLRECEAAADSWFAQKKNNVPQDAASQLAYLSKNGARTPVCEINRIQKTWDRCRPLYETGIDKFGGSMDWMERAANAGSPSAKASLGTRYWAEAIGILAKADRSKPAPNVDAQITHAVVLIREAARSKDPEALSWIAMTAPIRAMPNNEADIRRGALLLASCRDDESCAHSKELACILTLSNPSIDGNAAMPQILQQQHSGPDYEAMRARAQRVTSTWSNADVEEVFVEPFRELIDIARGER